MVCKRFLSLIFISLHPSIHSSSQSYEEHSGRAGKYESKQKDIKEDEVLSSGSNKTIEDKIISKINGPAIPARPECSNNHVSDGRVYRGMEKTKEDNKNDNNLEVKNKKESYYAEPKKKKQEREPRKLKEKIGQELADFVKNMHKNIEINAQICQIASDVLQELVEQDKNNKIINANSKELQECLKELERNNCEQQDYLENLEKTKKFLKSGCIN